MQSIRGENAQRDITLLFIILDFVYFFLKKESFSNKHLESYYYSSSRFASSKRSLSTNIFQTTIIPFK